MSPPLTCSRSPPEVAVPPLKVQFTMVYKKVMSIAANPNSTVGELNQVIRTDPAIASAVLRLANSSYYGLSKRVESLHMALVVIGMQEAVRLASSVAVINTFPKVEMGKYFDYLSFWRHCSEVATLSETLAKRFGSEDSEEFYMGGLLHDIGKIFLASQFAEEFRACMKHSIDNNYPLYRSERLLTRTDHSRIGAFLAKGWKLSRRQMEVIRYHHELDKVPHEKFATHAVALANAIAEIPHPPHKPTRELAERIGKIWLRLIKIDPSLKSIKLSELVRELLEARKTAHDFIAG